MQYDGRPNGASLVLLQCLFEIVANAGNELFVTVSILGTQAEFQYVRTVRMVRFFLLADRVDFVVPIDMSKIELISFKE